MMWLNWKKKWLLSLSCLFTVCANPPINPRIINDLSTWISDGGDQVVAINLTDGQYSKRYSGEGCADAQFVFDDGQGEWFRYGYVGQTDSGIYVVHTRDCGGGTGVFQGFIYFVLEKDRGIKVNWDQKRIEEGNERLFIRKIGENVIGDRFYGEITLDGNHLVVGEDPNPYRFTEERHYHLDNVPKPAEPCQGNLVVFQEEPFVSSAIIKDLCSKEGDLIIAIDLAGSQDTNRYFGGNDFLDDCGVSYEPFGYRYIGTTDSGISFLMTKQNNRVGLLLVTFEQGEDQRLLLKKLGEIELGDNWKGDICVIGNRLDVQPKEKKAYSLDVAITPVKSQLVSTYKEPAHKQTPALVEAAQGWDFERVAQLLKKGADINATDCYGCTALHYARSEEIVSHLIAKRADLEAKNCRGWTPLHVAFYHGRENVAGQLIKQGADCHVCTDDGESPWEVYHRIHPYERCIPLVFFQFAKPFKGCVAIACEIGDLNELSRIIKEGGDVNEEIHGYSPLEIASDKDWKEGVCALVSHGAKK